MLKFDNDKGKSQTDGNTTISSQGEEFPKPLPISKNILKNREGSRESSIGEYSRKIERQKRPSTGRKQNDRSSTVRENSTHRKKNDSGKKK